MEPSLGTLTWNSDLEPRNLVKPPHETSETYLEPWNFLEPLLGTLDCLEPFGTFTWNLGTSWNLYLELWNLLNPLLGTLTWNLGTSWNLDLEPLEPSKSFAWNHYLEPWNLPPRNLAGPCGMTAPEFQKCLLHLHGLENRASILTRKEHLWKLFAEIEFKLPEIHPQNSSGSSRLWLRPSGSSNILVVLHRSRDAPGSLAHPWDILKLPRWRQNKGPQQSKHSQWNFNIVLWSGISENSWKLRPSGLNFKFLKFLWLQQCTGCKR